MKIIIQFTSDTDSVIFQTFETESIFENWKRWFLNESGITAIWILCYFIIKPKQ